MSLEIRRRQMEARRRNASNPLIKELEEAAFERSGWQWYATYAQAYMNVRNLHGTYRVGCQVNVYFNRDTGKLSANIRTGESEVVIPLPDDIKPMDALITAERYVQKILDNGNTLALACFRYAVRFLREHGFSEEDLRKFTDEFPFQL